MSAVRRNGRRTIFCWCKSACAKAPAAQEKPVRTLSAQKNAGRFAPGNTAFLGRFVQMRRENGRILHKNAACFCTLCLVVTNVRGNTPYFPSHLPSSPARGTWIETCDGRGVPGEIAQSSPARGTWIETSRRCPERQFSGASSPARGTWIETSSCRRRPAPPRVVPRKGDVDRNRQRIPSTGLIYGSSPARGTWIETDPSTLCQPRRTVVPRKGDVDRNIVMAIPPTEVGGRPPQGGRG